MISHEQSIYPLVIVADRYSGTYSGGAFVAFNREPSMIPYELFGTDDEAAEAWGILKKVDPNSFAVGATVAEALDGLYEKLAALDTKYFV